MLTIVKNLEELAHLVNSTLDRAFSDTNTMAIVVSLEGDLGAGKTAFVKKAALFFDIDEDITSPTFVIQKEYKIPKKSSFKKMIHIDAYRLNNAKELEYLNWSENIHNPDNIIFLEWPSQVSGIEMPNLISVNININEDHSRSILIV